MSRPPSSATTWRRGLVLALAGAAVLGGSWIALHAAPKVTLTNAGLLFAHAPLAALAALLAAAGAAGVLAAAGRRLAKGAAGVLCVSLLALAAERALFRLEIGADRLSLRGLMGTRSLAWTEVHRVDAPAGGMTLEGRDGRAVAFSTTAFLPEQRASLERAVARHLASAQMPKAGPPRGAAEAATTPR